jgi:hypothetical protein
MEAIKETLGDRLTRLGAALAEKVCEFSTSSLAGLEAVCFAMFVAWGTVLALDIPFPISPALARLEAAMPGVDAVILIIVGAILGVHTYGLARGNRLARHFALSAGAVYWFTMTAALIWSGFTLLGAMCLVLFLAAGMASVELIVRSDD